jgi:hypothetical protein
MVEIFDNSEKIEKISHLILTEENYFYEMDQNITDLAVEEHLVYLDFVPNFYLLF